MGPFVFFLSSAKNLAFALPAQYCFPQEEMGRVSNKRFFYKLLEHSFKTNIALWQLLAKLLELSPPSPFFVENAALLTYFA